MKANAPYAYKYTYKRINLQACVQKKHRHTQMSKGWESSRKSQRGHDPGLDSINVEWLNHAFWSTHSIERRSTDSEHVSCCAACFKHFSTLTLSSRWASLARKPASCPAPPWSFPRNVLCLRHSWRFRAFSKVVHVNGPIEYVTWSRKH